MHHRTMFSVMMFLLSRCFHACNTIEKEEKKTNEHKRAVEGIRVNIFFLRSFFFFSFFSFSFSSPSSSSGSTAANGDIFTISISRDPREVELSFTLLFLTQHDGMYFSSNTHTLMHPCVHRPDGSHEKKREREKKNDKVFFLLLGSSNRTTFFFILCFFLLDVL